MPKSGTNGILWTGRILTAVWAAFWTWFGLASGIGEKLSPAGIFMHTLIPGLIFCAFLPVAWKWPTAGGILMLAVAALVAAGYPSLMFRHRPVRWDWYIFILLTMALPPLATGVLLLAGTWRNARMHP
jgi:hypothetical protein